MEAADVCSVLVGVTRRISPLSIMDQFGPIHFLRLERSSDAFYRDNHQQPPDFDRYLV